ncbi:hypothetical protein M569_01674, partial [Genlisea aurea]
MECNRDEANRAKYIAESKIEKKDFAGAKKFALKAQALYSELDGIAQLLKTIDVYVSAENKVSGEVDWYGVLEVSPSADEETIRKQYRKLALALHPDKNKSVGADGAFKLISEAWNLLSDKAARLAYNQRRGHKGFHQKVHMHSAPSAAPMPNAMFNYATRTTSASKPPEHRQKQPRHHTKPVANPTNKPSQQRTDTFWTICQKCKMHYEYLKVYLNQTLLCPNCRCAFMASATPPPENLLKPPSQVPRQKQKNITEYVVGRNAYSAGKNVNTSEKSLPTGSYSFKLSAQQQNPVSRETSVGTDPDIVAKAANVVQQAQEKYKRTCSESFPTVVSDAGVKKQKLDVQSGPFGTNYRMPQENGGFVAASRVASSSSSSSRFHSYGGPFRNSNSFHDLTVTESRNMLMAKGLSDIRSKLKAFSESTNKVAGKDKATSKHGKKVKSGNTNVDEIVDGNKNSDSVADSSAMNVPDADFHDFDMDRTEDSFGDDEVWAAYDDDDRMPRFYAHVSKVVSRKPFKLRVRWLNPKPCDEFGNDMDWIESGFYKTCGEFGVGRYETFKSINAFSQRVDFVRSSQGSFLIYPKRGDVWALYENWSSDWNGTTPDDVVHKYEMVTVADDYNSRNGVVVVPLVKVDGFRTVYRSDTEQATKIPTKEMLRFSHRVPYHTLTGSEGQNAPKGFLELDTAATPTELL